MPCTNDLSPPMKYQQKLNMPWHVRCCILLQLDKPEEAADLPEDVHGIRPKTLPSTHKPPDASKNVGPAMPQSWLHA